ncbi:MAG: trigger factor, partial [Candidatus Sungiibacteriota bacterium]
MQYALTKLPKSEIEIEITLSPDEFAPHLKTAARLISEKVKIEGFRPGKATYDAVKNKIGEHALYEEAAEIAVRASYPKAREQLVQNGKLSAEHPAIGRPEVTVTKLAPGNEFIYKIKMALMPSVILPDYRAIAKKTAADKKELAVSDEEMAKAISWLAESRMKLVAASRPAAHGDHVEVDFEIRHDGVKIAEGDSRNHPLVIGHGRFMPGFEDQLVGMQTSEQKSFTLAVPHDWREQSVAGKSLDFAVTMKAVQERI